MGYFQRVRRRHGFGDDTSVPDFSSTPVDTTGDSPTLTTTTTVSDPGNTGTLADPVDASDSDEIEMDNPAATSFKLVGNVCKPMTFDSLHAAQELQRQLNRIAQVKGLQKIAIDGAIGAGTVTLFASATGSSSDCSTIGANVVNLATAVQNQADAMGAPTLVTAPSSGAPISLATAAGKIVKAPATTQAASILDTVGLGTLSTPMQLALAGAAVGIIYFIGKSAKKSSTKNATRRSR